MCKGNCRCAVCRENDIPRPAKWRGGAVSCQLSGSGVFSVRPIKNKIQKTKTMSVGHKIKCSRITVASLVFLALLLQFVPAFQPAQAFSIGDVAKYINRIMAKIQVPDAIELTNEGGIKMGSWINISCLFKADREGRQVSFCGCKTTGKLIDGNLKLWCGWKDNTSCGGLSVNEVCVNPFSRLQIGQKSAKPLVDQKGNMTIPVFNIPRQCELRIPPAQDDCSRQCFFKSDQDRNKCIAECENEQIAFRKACNYFIDIQEAAAQEVYLAKKIYNSTDPKSECLFLRNCRSECSLRFGEVTYTITLLDIASFFTPVGALTITQKVINLIKIFKQLTEMLGLLKSIIQDGVEMVNAILDIGQNGVALFSALDKLGIRLSDSFFPATVVSGRAEEGYNGFVKMIDDFATNLMNYSTAKGQALQLAERTRQDIEDISEGGSNALKAGVVGFKKEKEIGFLFAKDQSEVINWTRKKELEKIVTDFQEMFSDIQGVVQRIYSLGVAITEPVTKRVLPEVCQSECNVYNNSPAVFGLPKCQDCLQRNKVSEGEFCWATSSASVYSGYECLTAEYLRANAPTDKQGQAQKDYNLDLPFCRQFVGSGTTWRNLCILDKDNRVFARLAHYSVERGGKFVDPVYIREVIDTALAQKGTLSYQADVWRLYWQGLAALCQSGSWVQTQLQKLSSMKGRHLAMLGACTTYSNGQPRENWPSLQEIAKLDVDYREYYKLGTLNLSSAVIDNAIKAYNQPPYGPFTLGKEIGPNPWFTNFQKVFQQINNYQTIFKGVNPAYIAEVIGKALALYQDGNGREFYTLKVLNYRKESWRLFWEDLARALNGDNWVDKQIADYEMEGTHQRMMNAVAGEVIKIGNKITGYEIIGCQDGGKIPSLCAVANFDESRGGNEIKDVDANFDGKIELTGPELVKNLLQSLGLDKTVYVRPDVASEVIDIKKNIEIVRQQKEDLQRTFASTSGSYYPSIYWQTASWCSSGDCTPLETEKMFNISYNSDLADVPDWGQRIDLLANATSQLDIISDALSYNLSPQEPVLSYYIERAKRKLSPVANDFTQAMADASTALNAAVTNYCKCDSTCKNITSCKSADYINYCSLRQKAQYYSDYRCSYCKATCMNTCSTQCQQGCYPIYDDCRAAAKKACGWDKNKFSSDCRSRLRQCDDWLNNCKTNCTTNCVSPCNNKCNPMFFSINSCSDLVGTCWCQKEYNRLVSEAWNKLSTQCRLFSGYLAYFNNHPLLGVDLKTLIDGLGQSFAPLKKSLQDLLAVWKTISTSSVQLTEVDVADDYVRKIAQTQLLTQQMIQQDVPDIERRLSGLSKVEDFINYFKGWWVTNSFTLKSASPETWNALSRLLNTDPNNLGLAYRLRDEASVAQKNLIEQIKSKAGCFGPVCSSSLKTGCCPSNVGQTGFLNRLQIFEQNLGKTMANLSQYFLPIAKALEEAAIHISQLKENVTALKAEIRMDILQSNRRTISEAQKATLPWEFEEPKFYMGDTEIKDLQDLKDAFQRNPLIFQSGIFRTVQQNLDAIDVYLRDAAGKMVTSGVFGREARANTYQTAITNVRDQNLYDLQRMIFGDGDTGNACRDLGPLLSLETIKDKDGNETIDTKGEELRCQTRKTDLLNNQDVIAKCQVLERADTTDLEATPEALQAEYEKLKTPRMNIVQENCNDGTTPSIVCPMWFCLDPDDPTYWGANNHLIDPFCIREEKYPKEGDGIIYKGNIVWDTNVHQTDGERVWPPPTKCLGQSGYAQKYLGAQELCLQTQTRMQALQELINLMRSGITIQGLTETCQQLEAQRDLKAECETFSTVEKAVQRGWWGWGNDKCDELPACGCAALKGEKPQCDTYGDCRCQGEVSTGDNQVLACQQSAGIYYCRECCQAIAKRLNDGLCKHKDADGIERGVLNCGLFAGRLPDLTSEGQAENLAKVREACQNRVKDLKSSLDGVMKVYSILIGVKSATGIYHGIQALSLGKADILAKLNLFVQKLEGMQKSITEAWNSENPEGIDSMTGGLKVKPLACVSHPAISYANGVESSGARGGQVCPNVDTLFGSLEQQFNSIRQSLQQLDLSRRVISPHYLQIGSLRLRTWDNLPVVYESINPLYDKADRIKWQASFVWALATALDFANQNCTCGQSWCKLPFCFSGLPFTLEPLKNASCLLVWTMREPMISVANKLEQDLASYFK